MRVLVRTVAVALLFAGLLAGRASAQAPAPTLIVPAGDGTTLRVERSPFRLALVDRAGNETVATVPGDDGAGLAAPALNGPQPTEPAGAAGAFPALGWVVGARADVTCSRGGRSSRR